MVFRNKTEARTFAAKKCHSRTGNLCPDEAQPRTNRGYFFSNANDVNYANLRKNHFCKSHCTCQIDVNLRLFA